MDSMRLHWSGILAICLLHQNVCAFTRSLPLDERWENHQQCIEMGAGDSFTPATEPSLILTFQQGFSGVVSIVMFELGDEHLGGIEIPGTSEVGPQPSESSVDARRFDFAYDLCLATDCHASRKRFSVMKKTLTVSCVAHRRPGSSSSATQLVAEPIMSSSPTP